MRFFPFQVYIKYTSIDREGRFVDECKKQTLPEGDDCTVTELSIPRAFCRQMCLK